MNLKWFPPFFPFFFFLLPSLFHFRLSPFYRYDWSWNNDNRTIAYIVLGSLLSLFLFLPSSFSLGPFARGAWLPASLSGFIFIFHELPPECIWHQSQSSSHFSSFLRKTSSLNLKAEYPAFVPNSAHGIIEEERLSLLPERTDLQCNPSSMQGHVHGSLLFSLAALQLVSRCPCLSRGTFLALWPLFCCLFLFP